MILFFTSSVPAGRVCDCSIPEQNALRLLFAKRTMHCPCSLLQAQGVCHYGTGRKYQQSGNTCPVLLFRLHNLTSSGNHGHQPARALPARMLEEPSQLHWTKSPPLEQGTPVTLRGSGTFKVAGRAARNVNNPETGELIHIPARKTVRFVRSKALQEALNA